MPFANATTSSFAPGATGFTKFSTSTPDAYANVNLPWYPVAFE